MKRSFLFALIAVVVITVLPTSIEAAAPITYVPGVTAGQAIKYSFVDDTNPAEEITIHVKAVSGSIVNYSKDNSASILSLNVSYILPSPWYFIGINLNVSHPIHGGPSSPLVSSVVSGYSVAGRTWNAVHWTLGGPINRDVYWERSTGILLFWSYQTISMTQIYTLISIGSDTAELPMEPGFVVTSLLAGLVFAILAIRKKQQFT